MIILGLTSSGLLFYFNYQRRKYYEAMAKQVGTVGTPSIGGPYTLITHDATPFASDALKGTQMQLLYFGFIHCPDICPEELDKVGKVMKLLDARNMGDVVLPVFITCDPQRDGPAELKEYLKGTPFFIFIVDFDGRIVGLTGAYEQVKQVAKLFRVYFRPASTSSTGTAADIDYLLDHSIFLYLMDKEGNFVQVFGKDATPNDIVQKILEINK